MSNDTPPQEYRSWLHYTVERVRDGSLILKESLAELEEELRKQDAAQEVRLANPNDLEARVTELELRVADAALVLKYLQNWRPEK